MSESNRRKKVFNLTRGYLENNNEKELNMALNLGEFKGPICDFIGFSQHKGECWNDTIQETFLFADGLKEVTQPLIYNLDTSYDVLSELVSSRLYPEGELNTVMKNTVNKLVKYITLMKVRFVTHYNFLTTSRNETKKHLWKKIYTKKRRLSAACGIGSAKSIINLHKGNANVYKSGLNSTLRNELLTQLLYIFGIKIVVAPYRPKIDTISNSYSFIISGDLMKPINGIYQSKGVHAFGFLKCDSVWRLYDDNRDGFIRINEKLLSLYLDEVNIALGIDSDDKLFIIKYEADGENVITKQYYDIDENKWIAMSTEWLNNHIFKNILTKTSVTVIRPQMKRLISIRGGKRGKICDKTRKKLKNRFRN